jgi:nicotinamidase-related amidase
MIPAARTALLLIDVVNDLSFPGSNVLVEQAEPMSMRLAAFKKRAAKAGVPIIYVNDNFGQWRSDFRQTVTHCCSQASPGHVVSRRLKPTAQDYFVLKPKHSGFYDTTLETLLSDLGITRVIVTGIAGNICVLFTANDAYMRGLRIYAPADCIVSNTADDNEYALRQIEIVLKGRTESSPRLAFSPAPGGRLRR